jgi:RimJ/RimL family protein N-acetyltransferase
MLVKYAFECEQVDILHCFCEDYNIRSRRVWEKNGFTLIFKEEIPQPHKGKLQYHWKLTKDEYDEHRFAHNDAICSPPKTICREA